MLRVFKEGNEQFVNITGDRYKVSIKGKITDTLDQTTVKPDINGLVEIVVLGKRVKVKQEVVVLMGYKPMYRPESFWLDWEVLFEDNNPQNLHPKNLIWKPPSGGQPCPEIKGFYIIPGSSQFAVNKEGTLVYSRRLNRFVKVRKNIKKRYQKGHYLVYNGWLDTGKQITSSVHRAVALALITYESTVNSLTVNHKNGVKDDNKVDNLEWTTYKENNAHAKETGLCNVRIPLWVKDTHTGIVTRYKSMSEAAAVMGTDAAHIVTCLRSSKRKVIYLRYLLSLVDLGDNWPNDIYTHTSIGSERNSSKTVTYAAYNIHTKQTIISDYPGRLRRELSMSSDQFRIALESPYPWPFNNYIIWSTENPRNLRQFKSDELAAYKDKTGITKPIRVTFKDGSTKVFAYQYECAKYYNLKIPTLSYRMTEGGGRILIGGDIVEFIQQ